MGIDRTGFGRVSAGAGDVATGAPGLSGECLFSMYPYLRPAADLECRLGAEFYNFLHAMVFLFFRRLRAGLFQDFATAPGSGDSNRLRGLQVPCILFRYE
jgi:hypothetical protein